MNVLLTTLLLFAAHGGDGASELAAPSVASERPALAAGLATMEAAEVCADVRFLSADEMGGRDSPSPEQRIAARYIAARLQRLGFRPGASNGWFYEYELEYAALDGERTALTALAPSGAPLARWRFAEDYFSWVRTSEELELEGPAVFLGAESEQAFAEHDLAGKWAVTLVPERGEEVSFRRAREWARDAGALGLVRVPAPGVENDIERRFGGAARRALEPLLSWPRTATDEAPAERERTLPVDYLRTSAFAGLVGGESALAELVVGSELPFRLRETRRPSPLSGRVVLENVCGLWPGSDPQLAAETIVLTAHYDHTGRIDGVVQNGADDNASGTSGLLAVAEGLAAMGPLRRSVLVMWVSAEEYGLFGSRAWTEQPFLPEGARTLCNVNIDMIGRNAPEALLVTPTSEHPAHNGLTDLVLRHGPLEGFTALGSADAYFNRSDQYNFHERLGVPVAFLFADVHEDYHKPTDDAEKIDCDKVRRVARLVLRVLDGLQQDDAGL